MNPFIFSGKKLVIFNLVLFTFVVFLVRLPNIYLLPFKTSLFLTNNIVRLLVLSILAINLYLYKRRAFANFHGLGFKLVAFYFFTQSLSVIYAYNLNSFLLVYKDLLFALLLFIIVAQITNNKNLNFFLKIIILVTFFNILFQILFYLFPSVIYPFILFFFNEKYLQFFNFQSGRNRFFGDSLDEAFIPLIMWMFMRERAFMKKILLLLLVIGIIFIAFISNWRTKILILLFSLGVSAIMYFKYVKKYLFLFILLILLTTFLSSSFSLYTVKTNIIDRLIFNDTIETKIINSRINYWKDAIEIGLSSPIIGVGLGNYYDNLSEKSKQANTNQNINRRDSFITIDDPHNLFISTFASTGFLGLISLILLLGHFFITDVVVYIKKQALPQTLIIIFWSLFIFALFNPWMYFSYLMPFWLLRGFIEKYKIMANYEKN